MSDLRIFVMNVRGYINVGTLAAVEAIELIEAGMCHVHDRLVALGDEDEETFVSELLADRFAPGDFSLEREVLKVGVLTVGTLDGVADDCGEHLGRLFASFLFGFLVEEDDLRGVDFGLPAFLAGFLVFPLGGSE